MVLIHDSFRRQWAVQIIELIALVFQNYDVASETNTIINNCRKDNIKSYYPDNLQKFNFIKEQGHFTLEDTEDHLRMHNIKNEVKRKRWFKESICYVKSDSSNTETEINISSTQPTGIPHTIKFDDGTHNKYNVDTVDQMCTDTLQKKKYTTILPTVRLKTSPTDNKQSLDRKSLFLQLQKFAFHFLKNGFSTLVDEVYSILISNTQHNIDLSHYFWVLLYFCRFCEMARIEFKLIRRIVSLKIITNMAYEGNKIAEKLRIAVQQKQDDIHIYVRRLYLVVMAIKEVIKTIEFYQKTSVTPKTIIDLLQDFSCNDSLVSTSWKEDIKSLFSTLINFYNSDIQPFEYLRDLIITNHKLILFLGNLDNYWTSNDTTEYYIRFATSDIMYKYGTVLQNYIHNDELVNDAILTLIHNLIGHLEFNPVILQTHILESLLNITENKYHPCKKWRDLIERVLNVCKSRAICAARGKGEEESQDTQIISIEMSCNST